MDEYSGMHSTHVNDHYHDIDSPIAVGIAFMDTDTGWLGQQTILLKFGMDDIDDIISEGGLEISKTTDSGHTFSEILLSLIEEIKQPKFAGQTADCGVTKLGTIQPRVIGSEWTCVIYAGEFPTRIAAYMLTSDRGETWHAYPASGNELFLDASTGWRLSSSGKLG